MRKHGKLVGLALILACLAWWGTSCVIGQMGNSPGQPIPSSPLPPLLPRAGSNQDTSPPSVPDSSSVPQYSFGGGRNVKPSGSQTTPSSVAQVPEAAPPPSGQMPDSRSQNIGGQQFVPPKAIQTTNQPFMRSGFQVTRPDDSSLPSSGTQLPGIPASTNFALPQDRGSVQDRGTAPENLPSDSAGQSNDNPTGRQEPGVSLEWVGPPTTKIGQPVTYQIIVKNVNSCPVHQVIVRNRVPAGVTVQGTEPRAFNEGNVWLWDLGTLQPHQEKRLDMQLLPEIRGDLSCQATVTLTGSTIARVRVREPKLTIKAQAPPKVLLGDVTTITLIVNNPGDGQADHVRVKAMLPEGLEHSRGKVIDYDLGNLGGTESRSIQLVCVTKSAGEQKVDAMATAEGNLNAHDAALVDVQIPRLDLKIAGPHLRYLDRRAVYTLHVANPGSAAASNVTVNDQIPPGFKFVGASDGGRHDFATRTVTWFVGDLTPGQARDVHMEVIAVNAGTYKHVASALAARGLKTESEITTRVEGLPALLMELVDLDDPVEIGADTGYEIRITNTGSKTETNLQLICTIPDKMEFRGAQGAAGTRFRLQGRDLIFEPLPRLAPRADALFRVNVRGLAAGDLRFRARITADGLTDPVLKEESTKVYADEPESRQPRE